MSLKEQLMKLDGRTVIAILFTVAYLIVSVIAILKGYTKEVLSQYVTFIGLIVGYYFGSKTLEKRGGE